MEVSIAQIKLKTGDYAFNLKNILSKVETAETDIVVFPQCDMTELGGKDLCYDEKCNLAQMDFYNEIADKKIEKSIFIGDVLIKNGEIIQSEDGFYDIDGKIVYVAD